MNEVKCVIEFGFNFLPGVSKIKGSSKFKPMAFWLDFTFSFTHAHELVLCLCVFSQTGPSR